MSGRTHHPDPFLQQLYSLGRENGFLGVFMPSPCILPVTAPWATHSLCEFSLLGPTAKVPLCFNSSLWTDVL